MSILGVENEVSNQSKKLFDLKMEDGAGRKIKPFYTGNKVPATQVRILPARDHSYSPEDPAFQTSHIPYRDTASGKTYKDTGTPMFTNWVVKANGYKFLGNRGHNLLSPLTISTKDNPKRDPVQDMASVARTDPRFIKMTEEQNVNGKRFTPLPKLKEFGYMNILTLGQSTATGYDIQVYRAPWVTILNLFDQLCWRTAHGDEPIDPDWPRFLLGDVTSPKHGLACVLRMGVSPATGFQQPEFSFTSVPQEPKWHYGKYPLDPDDPNMKAFAEYVLAQRNDIWDSDNGALKFYEYGEIVEVLCEDGMYPPELIALACGPHCDLPDFIKKAATHSTPTQPTAPPAGQAPAGPAAPPVPGAPSAGQTVPSAPTAPATPAAPPAGQTTQAAPTAPPAGQPAQATPTAPPTPGSPPAGQAAPTAPTAPPAGQSTPSAPASQAAPAPAPQPTSPPPQQSTPPRQPAQPQAAPTAPASPPAPAGQDSAPPAASPPQPTQEAPQNSAPAQASAAVSGQDTSQGLDLSMFTDEEKAEFEKLQAKFENKEQMPPEEWNKFLALAGKLHK